MPLGILNDFELFLFPVTIVSFEACGLSNPSEAAHLMVKSPESKNASPIKV
jgi:hypothetical protein